MANTLLTIGMVTKEAVRLFRNSNAFLMSINRQYDDSFARTGAKIGSTLRIRMPNDYVVRTGPTAVPQSTNEPFVTLALATQKGVDISFSTAERTMSIDNYSERYLAPMVNVLAGNVAADVIAGSESIPHLVHNVDTSGNTTSPTAATWLLAGAVLNNNSAPMGNRKIVIDPLTEARTVSSLAGLFNQADAIGKQYMTGTMRRALGFEWMMDQTVIKHTTAAYGTLPTVNGANQTGTSIITTATTAPINAGDIITIAGVFGVNRVTKQNTGALRQFAVTANVAQGSTVIPIYPALNPQSSGADVAFETVLASPANGAVINVVTNASEVYRKNFAFCPEAVTMAMADLEIPRGIHEGARETYDDISMRMITAYNIMSDQMITRLDILYGYLWVRPEWAVVIADAV